MKESHGSIRSLLHTLYESQQTRWRMFSGQMRLNLSTLFYMQNYICGGGLRLDFNANTMPNTWWWMGLFSSAMNAGKNVLENGYS